MELEQTDRAWIRWQRIFPLIVAAALVLWLMIRQIPLGWIDVVHDHAVLPVALKAIYGQQPLLWVCSAAAAVVLLLWPQGERWPIFSAAIAVVLLGWVILYGMFRNTAATSFPLAALLVYALTRYLWQYLLRIPLFNRAIFHHLCEYAQSNPRCDLYYDSMRAAWLQARGAESSPGNIWRRTAGTKNSGRWGALFAITANRYRTHVHNPLVQTLKMIVWRPVPQRLRFAWLYTILQNYEQHANAAVRDAYTANLETWNAAFVRLFATIDAIAEFLIFDPLRDRTNDEDLLFIAQKYDNLARMVLCRIWWRTNTRSAASQESDDTETDQLEQNRKSAVERSVIFRSRYLWSDGSAPDAKVQRIISESVPEGESAVARQLLMMSYIQTDQFESSQKRTALDWCLTQLKKASEKRGKIDRRVLQKALEVAFYEMRALRQEVMAMLEMQRPSRQSEESEVDAAFEGHLYWAQAKSLNNDELERGAWRAAAHAFARSGCPEFLERVQKEFEVVVQRKTRRSGSLSRETT